MILYGSYTSPYVRHCRIELADGRLNYGFIETDYDASDKGSPTKRVPFMQDGELMLTDSSSIIMHIKLKQGLAFIDSAEQMDIYTMVGTAMDSAINLFLLEKQGQTPDNNSYLKRQQKRVDSILDTLDELNLAYSPPYTTAEIRLGCFLDWGLFRRQIQLSQRGNLQRFLSSMNSWKPFAETKPPVPQEPRRRHSRKP